MAFHYMAEINGGPDPNHVSKSWEPTSKNLTNWDDPGMIYPPSRNKALLRAY